MNTTTGSATSNTTKTVRAVVLRSAGTNCDS